MIIKELLTHSPFSEDELEWLGPVDESNIVSVEAELGFNFPNDFRGFLISYGGGGPINTWVSGIGPEEKKHDCGYIIGDTEYYRSEYDIPKNFIVIQRDQDDNDPYCFDTNDNKIYAVDIHSKESSLVAKNFTNFLKEFILFSEE